MKHLLLIILPVLFLLYACNNENETEKIEETHVDIAKIEKEIENVMLKTDEATKNKDFDFYEAFLHDDGIFIGTDPSLGPVE